MTRMTPSEPFVETLAANGVKHVLGIVVIGAIAYLFDLFMRRLERWLVPWKGRI